jgi:hypothetical protein
LPLHNLSGVGKIMLNYYFNLFGPPARQEKLRKARKPYEKQGKTGNPTEQIKTIKKQHIKT